MSTLRSIQSTIRSLYRRVFSKEEDARTREIVDVLRQVPLLQELSRGTLADLAEVVHQRSYARDEFVFYENDPGLGLYVVQSGRVRVLAEAEHGAVHELRQVSERGFFGELSLLGDFRRMETAQALTDTRVLGLFRPDLKTVLKRNPKAGAAVLSVLARHLAVRQLDLIRLLEEKAGRLDARRALGGLVDPVE